MYESNEIAKSKSKNLTDLVINCHFNVFDNNV